MLTYVDLEHPRLQNEPGRWQKALAQRLMIKYRLEEISGDRCLIVRYPDMTPALFDELTVRAIFVGGNSTDWEHYDERDLAGLRAVLRQGACPIIGFCGGMQVLTQAWGGEIGAMGPAGPGDPAPPPELDRTPGMRQERGFAPVELTANHPVLAGLAPRPVFYQSHYWEVKVVPPEFEILAQSPLCGVQMLAHRTRLLFGTQFHPELYDQDHLAGRRLLENFVALAQVGSAGRFAHDSQ